MLSNAAEAVEVDRIAESEPPATSRSREVVHVIPQRGERRTVDASLIHAVFSAMTDAVIVTDEDGRIVTANHGARTFFGPCVHLEAERDVWHAFPSVISDGDEDSLVSRVRNGCSGASARFRYSDTIAGAHRHGLVTVDRFRADDFKGLVFVIKETTEIELESRTDPLTGLANRGEFDRCLRDEHARMHRGLIDEVSLLFLDVDHFKRFNSRYGHQLGDEVLRRVGDALKESVREIDVAARYGGEEFCIILSGTGTDGAANLAERVRETIAAIRIETETDGIVSVTVSIGVATEVAGSRGYGKELVKRANCALRKAKTRGRDRVVVV